MQAAPPVGPEWIHEVKWDGWRLQLHKQGPQVRVYGREGKELPLSEAVVVATVHLPDCVVDAELVANDGEGRHSYDKLLSGDFLPYVWCFDLLALAGADLRGLPLEHRREKLSDVLIEADTEMFGFSDGFSDPLPLLARCEQMTFEGVVSKRRTSPYRSGPQTDWVKVTCSGWRDANVHRARKMAAHSGAGALIYQPSAGMSSRNSRGRLS